MHPLGTQPCHPSADCLSLCDRGVRCGRDIGAGFVDDAPGLAVAGGVIAVRPGDEGCHRRVGAGGRTQRLSTVVQRKPVTVISCCRRLRKSVDVSSVPPQLRGLTGAGEQSVGAIEQL